MKSLLHNAAEGLLKAEVTTRGVGRRCFTTRTLLSVPRSLIDIDFVVASAVTRDLQQLYFARRNTGEEVEEAKVPKL